MTFVSSPKSAQSRRPAALKRIGAARSRGLGVNQRHGFAQRHVDAQGRLFVLLAVVPAVAEVTIVIQRRPVAAGAGRSARQPPEERVQLSFGLASAVRQA
jgi:hypothetical protein